MVAQGAADAPRRGCCWRSLATLRLSLSAGQFCDLFPGDDHLAEFVDCTKISLDFGQRKPFAGVTSCDDVCRLVHVRANVVKQKVGQFTRRERKEAVLDELTRRYNNAHPVQGEGMAADRLRVDKELWDEFERKSRESATSCCSAPVPPPLRDVPLQFQADTQLRRDLAERKLSFAFQVVQELRRRTVETAGWDQDVVCVVGGERGSAGAVRRRWTRRRCSTCCATIFSLYSCQSTTRRDGARAALAGASLCARRASGKRFVGGCAQYKPCIGDHPRDSDFAFYFDCDIGAAVNFLSILCFMMRHGGLRPQAFAPANAKDVYRSQ